MPHIKVESDEQNGPTPTQFEFVSVGVKQELLSETEPTSTVDTGNCVPSVAHLDADESQSVKIKSEINLPDELEDPEKEHDAAAHPRTLLKNPFASSKCYESNDLKLMNSEHTIDQEGVILTLEGQKRTPTPLNIMESFTFSQDSEDIADIKKYDAKMPVLYNETINETELIIKSESVYEENSTLDTLYNTNTDTLYSTTEDESNEYVPVDESFINLATNVLNNPLAYSVRIVNVSTLVEDENLLQPSTQPPAVFHPQIERPKRSSTAKQIQYRISGDMMKCYRKHRKGKPVKQLPRRSRRVKINQQCSINRNKTTKQKLTKLKDFPQPLKLEGTQNRRQPNECDIATELPRPIVLKREYNFNWKQPCFFTSWQLQPQIRIKRLSRSELMKVHFQAKEFRRPTHSSHHCLSDSRPSLTAMHNTLAHNSSQNRTQHDIPFYSCEPWATPSLSYSHCDSGTSTSGAGENENILLEIAAERAFINNHLIEFGFSPVHFELYNDLNELCIFLKYLFGKHNSIS